MLCAVGGVLIAIAVRLFLAKSGIDDHVPAKLPVYGGLAIAVTFLLWLRFFGN